MVKSSSSSPSSARAIDTAGGAALKPQGCTNFKLRQLMRGVAQHYDAEVGQCGLKTTQYSLLTYVHKLGPAQPSLMAEAMRMDASTLTRNLQPLIKQGLLVMSPGVNGRTRLVHITDEGRALRAEAQRHWRRAQDALNQKLGVARVVALHALIDEAIGLLDAGHESSEGARDDHAA